MLQTIIAKHVFIKQHTRDCSYHFYANTIDTFEKKIKILSAKDIVSDITKLHKSAEFR